MAKSLFGKLKIGVMKTSPNLPRPTNGSATKDPIGVSTSGLGSKNAAPRQNPGLAGLRSKKLNNPLKSLLAPDKPYGK